MNINVPILPLKRAFPNKSVFLYTKDHLFFAPNKQIKLFSYLNQPKINAVVSCGGIHSHHALTLAQECAKRGWLCCLFLRGRPLNPPQGVYLLLRLLTPHLFYLAPELYRNHKEEKMEEEAEKLQQQGYFPLVIPEGGAEVPIQANSLAITYLQEIQNYEQQNKIRFDRILVALGTGGTYLHLLKANQEVKLSAYLTGVPALANPSYFYQRWQGVESLKAGEIWDTPKWSAFGKVDPFVQRVVLHLARTEGILVDPLYDGKVFATLEARFQKEPNLQENILVWNTGGLFDVFSLKWRNHEQNKSGS